MSYPIIDAINQSNYNTYVQVPQLVNAASGNLFGALFLLSIYLGYYFLFSKEQTINDLLASSFVTMIIATLMLLVDLLTWQLYTTAFSLMLIIFLVKFWTS